MDLSHPAWESHIQSVQEILKEMPSVPEQSLIAFNKVDRIDSENLALAQQKYPEAVFMSATQNLGLDTLRKHLLQLIADKVLQPTFRTQNCHTEPQSEKK